MSCRRLRTCEPWFGEDSRSEEEGRTKRAAPAGYYSTVPNPTDSRQPGGQAALDQRQLAGIARNAALKVYGVTDVVGTSWLARLADRLGFGSRGVHVTTAPTLHVSLNLELAPGVPRDSVLSNVSDAVRYKRARV